MSELSTKSVEDLNVIEKAIELQKNGSALGTLADEKPDTELFDPLTSMLLEDYV
jgi:hypothetical protein